MSVLVVTAQPAVAAEQLVPAAFAAIVTSLGQGSIQDMAGGPNGSVLVQLSPGLALRRGVGTALEAAVTAQLDGEVRVTVQVLRDQGGPIGVMRRLALDWMAAAGPDAFLSTQQNAYQKAIRELLDGDAIRIVFQPIVEAWTGRVAGYEALCRGPKGDILEMPDALFDALERSTLQREAYLRLVDLARDRAAACLPDTDLLLFINAPPDRHWVRQDDAAPRMASTSWPWNRVVMELTEKVPVHDREAFLRVIEWGRSAGLAFALDDVGAGYSGLSSFALLQPEYTKVDMGIVRGCDADPTRRAIIASLVALAHRTGSQVIAEGVETMAELEAVRWLGVDLVQGYLVAAPTEVPDVARNLWLPTGKPRRRARRADTATSATP